MFRKHGSSPDVGHHFRFPVLFVAGLLFVLGSIHSLSAQEQNSWSASDKERIKTLIQKALSPHVGTKKEPLEKLKSFDPMPDGMRKWALRIAGKALGKGSKAEPDGSGKVTFAAGRYDGSYVIKGTGGGKKPLVVALHGGMPGTTGDAPNAIQTWNSASRKAILVAPNQPPQEDHNWKTEYGRKFVRAIIEEVKRTYAVNTNRIYVVGFSGGGFGAWYMAPIDADLYAAFSGNGARPAHGHSEVSLRNLFNTPVYWYYGRNDDVIDGLKENREARDRFKKWKKEYGGGFEFEYDEHDGGHEHHNKEKALKWVMSKRRNPYPEKVLFDPTVRNRLFWVRAKRRCFATRVKKNHFKFQGASSGIGVYLNDRLANLDEPVKIEAEGEVVFNETVEPSVYVLIKTLGATRDPNMYFWARARVK